MHRKSGNINLCLLIALIAVLSASVISALAINSKYNAKEANLRLENRYIAESGVDLAAGLFLNYLSNRDFVITYEQNADGSFTVNDLFSPYILDEIKNAENTDMIPLDIVSNECNSYLSNAGYFDFTRNGGVNVKIQTFSQKDNFKISGMCITPNFLSSSKPETESKFSRINPIYLTVTSKFKGGEVMANIIISNLKIKREPFKEVTGGNRSSVSASIDTSGCKIAYQNFQNYRRTK